MFTKISAVKPSNKGMTMKNEYIIHARFQTVWEHRVMDDGGDRRTDGTATSTLLYYYYTRASPPPLRIRGTNNNFYLKRAAVPRVRVKTGRHAQQNRVVTPSPTTTTMGLAQTSLSDGSAGPPESAQPGGGYLIVRTLEH